MIDAGGIDCYKDLCLLSLLQNLKGLIKVHVFVGRENLHTSTNIYIWAKRKLNSCFMGVEFNVGDEQFVFGV